MIRFEHVHKRFGRQTVLDDLSLEIDRGDRIALIGSNGAGKTTLIRCLLGEYRHEGRIEVDGQVPRLHRTEVLKRIGFVPQIAPPLRMPVGQLLQFAAGVCDSDSARMRAVAGELGLDVADHAHQPFDRLSGGMKQKLLISIALGRDCDVLVLDEPAANLDPEARHRFFELLAERQERAAMLISSHRLDEVAALVNRVIELDRGKVVLDDHVADQLDMDARLECELRLTQADEAFARSIEEWGFVPEEGGRRWRGLVAGPDRLRFLGVLSRYAGLLEAIRLETAAPVTKEKAS